MSEYETVVFFFFPLSDVHQAIARKQQGNTRAWLLLYNKQLVLLTRNMTLGYLV